jgi:hypothetical protein
MDRTNQNCNRRESTANTVVQGDVGEMKDIHASEEGIERRYRRSGEDIRVKMMRCVARHTAM